MDLSDGSDVEGEVDLDVNAENALLGSDDEDVNNRLIYDDEPDYDEHEEHEYHLATEDGDVLDLELHEDEEIEGFDESEGQNRVAPIKVRPSAMSLSHGGGSHYSSNINARHDGEDEDDDDDDSRNTRSRFLSERNTEDINSQSHSMQSSMGNPIQTLGTRPGPTPDGRPKQQWNNARPQMQRFNGPQRFPMNRSALLGEGPRQSHSQVRGMRPQSGAPVQQFQGNLFTDFTKPMRPGPHPHPQQGNQVRGVRPGGFQNEGNQGGGRPPGMMMRGNRHNGPNFPHPMRPRGNHPGHMQHNRPPGNPNWRSRPEMRPHFQGAPNHPGMGGMGMMPPQGPAYAQEPRPPFFMDQQQGMRPDLNPHYNPNIATVQPMQQHNMYPNGPGLGPGPQQPPRMHMVRPEMQPPVQPVQPFYPANPAPGPHAQPPYMENPHQLAPQGQGYWPHPNSGGESNGWANGPPNYPGPPNQVGAQPVAVRMPLQPPLEQSIPQTHHQQPPHRFNEGLPPLLAPPRHVYEDQSRSQQQPYYDQQSTHLDQQRYPSHQEEHRISHVNSYEHSAPLSQSSRRDEYRQDYDRSQREDVRYHSKRRYEYSGDEGYLSRSPEKRLNGRLGPPVKNDASPVRDQKSEELMKIREETKKTIGLDDDYIKKLEEQKKLREEILRKKAAARKKLTGESSEKAGEAEVSSTSRSSIYINPKAFRGDLSALNLTNVSVIRGSSGGAIIRRQAAIVSDSAKVVGIVPKTAIASSIVSSNKPRTILKIIKDKHGNVISRSKVIVVPKQKNDGRSATTN